MIATSLTFPQAFGRSDDCRSTGLRRVADGVASQQLFLAAP